MTKKRIHGTVSWGTTRPQDLTPSFLFVLHYFNRRKWKKYYEMVPSDAWDQDDHPFWSSEDAHFLIEDLFYELNNYAPKGHYFGAHPGDLSDLGFWPVEQQ